MDYNPYPSRLDRPPLLVQVPSNTLFMDSSMEFFEKPSHGFTKILHRLYAFLIFLNLSRIPPDSHIPVCGSGNNYLVIQKQVV